MAKKDEQAFIESFGKHLADLRTKRGLSQEALANDADIPINQVGRIERGEISTSLKTIFKIAAAMNVDPIRLFENLD